MGFAKRGDEVARVVKVVEDGGEVGGLVGCITWETHWEAEYRNPGTRGPGDHVHGGECRRQRRGDPRAPQGAFGKVEVQPDGRSVLLEDGDGGIQIVLGADEVAVVKVPTIELEGRGQFGDEGV